MHHLYYFYYFLFTILIVKSIWYLGSTLGNSNFIFDCCQSDYFYNKLLTPRYPQAFYGLYFLSDNNAYYYFGVIKQSNNEIANLRLKYNNFTTKKPPKAYMPYIQYYSNVTSRVNSSSFFSSHLAVKSNFRFFNYGYIQKRFTHTSTKGPLLVDLIFSRGNWQDRAFLINKSWDYYMQITKTKPLFLPSQEALYNTPLKTPIPSSTTDFAKFLELNTPYHFLCLEKYGINPTIYNRDLHKNILKKQSEPDVVFQIDSKNSFNIQTSFGLDLKTGNQVGDGLNKIISTNREIYTNLLMMQYQKDSVNLNELL